MFPSVSQPQPPYLATPNEARGSGHVQLDGAAAEPNIHYVGSVCSGLWTFFKFFLANPSLSAESLMVRRDLV